MEQQEFLSKSRQELATIVQQRQKPRTVALMYDGTRRMLKVEADHHNDAWLYDKKHIDNLMHRVMDAVDFFFDVGVHTVVGPLASMGNLQRRNFMPNGLQRLLEPMLDDYSTRILARYDAAVHLYGDLDYARSLGGGSIVDDISEKFAARNPQHPRHYVAIGIGFSTDHETTLIARMAVDRAKATGAMPSKEELITAYFGFPAPPIDIFIRTNEMKASGGQTPLLTGADTQWYVPVAPGIISMSEPVLRDMLHDYLFNRTLSGGTHEHQPINAQQAEDIRSFYVASQSRVLGVGRKVADVWLHKL